MTIHKDEEEIKAEPNPNNDCSLPVKHNDLFHCLYEVNLIYISEGSVSHINGVRPGFIELHLVSHYNIRIQSTGAAAHFQTLIWKL